MRPNFWPNTPDILAGPLRDGPPSAFRCGSCWPPRWCRRYGIYSGYELCENEPHPTRNEEYLHSEKYEMKQRDWDRARLAGAVHHPRQRHPPAPSGASPSCAPRVPPQLDNDDIIAYSKASADGGDDVVLCVVNLDPDSSQEDTLVARPRRARVCPAPTPFEALRRADRLRRSRGAGPSPVRPPRSRRSARATSSTCEVPEPQLMSDSARSRLEPRSTPDDRWYQRAVFYEVLVRGLLRRATATAPATCGPHREARLPRVARRRLPLAAALLPVAAARRRLRHLRLLHRPARLRRRSATPSS